MKRVICFVAGILFFGLTAFSQVNKNDLIFSLTPQLGIPLGDLKNTNKILLGGHAAFEKPTSDRLRILLQFGGGIMQGKNFDAGFGVEDAYPAVSLIQLRAGAKYFVTESGLFAGLYAGGAQATIQRQSSFGFSFAPVIGHEFGRGDLNVRYDYSKLKGGNVTIVCFGIGYHF
jgi:hypothetical protein